MVVCDENGVIYDLWIVEGSKHENTALKTRLQKSIYLRELFCHAQEVIGDLAYRGMENVKVVGRKVGSKEDKSRRQIVESVLSSFDRVNHSRWRRLSTLLAYLYGVASYFSFWRYVI